MFVTSHLIHLRDRERLSVVYNTIEFGVLFSTTTCYFFPSLREKASLTQFLFLSHPSSGETLDKIPLSSGDDAGDVAWTTATSDIKLYASHTHFITKTANLRGAHW